MIIKAKQIKVTTDFDANGHKIVNVSNPINNNDVVNKGYFVDNNIMTSGGTINGNVYATNLSGINHGDQIADGYTITGSGTTESPFVASIGLIPSYTTAQRIILTPHIGQMVYDTDLGLMFFYNKNSAWEGM